MTKYTAKGASNLKIVKIVKRYLYVKKRQKLK